MENLNKQASRPSSQISGVAKSGVQAFNSIGEQLESKAHEVGSSLGEIASKFSDQSSEYLETGRKYIRANPLRGAAIAVGTGLTAGYVLGMVTRPRRQQH